MSQEPTRKSMPLVIGLILVVFVLGISLATGGGGASQPTKAFATNGPVNFSTTSTTPVSTGMGVTIKTVVSSTVMIFLNSFMYDTGAGTVGLDNNVYFGTISIPAQGSAPNAGDNVASAGNADCGFVPDTLTLQITCALNMPETTLTVGVTYFFYTTLQTGNVLDTAHADFEVLTIQEV
ncbi:MAG TPA: hypothetical protein VF910_07685 [Candidatus Bathyarchaeia archaeon]